MHMQCTHVRHTCKGRTQRAASNAKPSEARGGRRTEEGDRRGHVRTGEGPRWSGEQAPSKQRAQSQEGARLGGAPALSQEAATVHVCHGPGVGAVSPHRAAQGKSLEDTGAGAPRGAQPRQEDLRQPVRVPSPRGRRASVASHRAGPRQGPPAPLQPWPGTPGLLPASVSPAQWSPRTELSRPHPGPHDLCPWATWLWVPTFSPPFLGDEEQSEVPGPEPHLARCGVGGSLP